MAKYDVFLSYSVRDGRMIVNMLAQYLYALGISVYTASEMRPGGNWLTQIEDAIRSIDVFVPIITDGYVNSEWALAEMKEALACSQSRSKTIIPLVATDPQNVPSPLMTLQWAIIDPADPTKAAESIARRIKCKMGSERMYERLAEYIKLKDGDKTALVICELLDHLSAEYSPDMSLSEKRETFKEMYRLYGLLAKYTGRYDDESKALVRGIVKTLDRVRSILNDEVEGVFTADLYACAFALQMIYLDRDIRSECADVLTYGEVVNPCPIDSYIEKQKPFVAAFKKLYADGATNDKERYTEDEWEFIIKASTCIFDRSFKDAPLVRDREVKPSALSKDDEILLSIAHFLQEGNKLFDLLQQKNVQGSFLRCLLTSYERLKTYCEIVGAGNIAAECVDRIVEIRNKVDKQDDTEKADGKAEKGIKSLLGFTLKGSGEYDVFISFKDEDSDLGETIYKYCQKHLKEPFWSKRTLPELSKSEYEDAIYDALRRSKHFFVVLSKLEYLSANWIKKEMATFDRAITEGRKKGANFVFVVTDDVYRQIIESNKMCLDERYCGYQIVKMSEYEATLYKYLS